MNKKFLTHADFEFAAQQLGCEVETLYAVAEVESGTQGAFCPDGFPTILFEGHIFYRYTNGKFANSDPDICYESWTKKFYGKTWQEERKRLERAVALSRNAALMSASWGRFQIMGFNFALCGCVSIQKFVNAMCMSEYNQGELFIKYILHERLDIPLRERNWLEFAVRYNGPLYWKNQYDVKLERAYQKHKMKGVVK